MFARQRQAPFASQPTGDPSSSVLEFNARALSARTTTAEVPLYTNLGCWNDSDTPGRILTGTSTFRNSKVDVQFCQSFCTSHSYTVFGVEAVDNCLCGNDLANNYSSANPKGCNQPCVANSEQICGGVWHINLYSLTATTATVSGYSNLGCWSDVQFGTDHILTGTSLVGNAAVGVTVCQNFCSSASYSIFGVKAQGNCLCGNELANEHRPADPRDCNEVCVANSNQVCGATERINIYSNTRPANPSSSSSSPSSVSSSAGSNHHKGLNSGAIAGIVVGSVLFLVLAAVAAFILRRRRRTNSMHPETSNLKYPETSDIPTELPANVQETALKDPWSTMPQELESHEPIPYTRNKATLPR